MNGDTDNDLDVTPSALGKADADCKPTHEEIAIVAYQLYEDAGCPNGFAEGHWEAAEQSLLANPSRF